MYEDILDVAEELFMKQGYNETSTRQIANILKITQPNIYYHFKNKEAIYFQVMKRLGQEVAQNLIERSSKADCSFEDKVCDMSFYLQERHPYSLFMMMHDIQYNLSPEVSKQMYTIWSESYKQPFLTLFEQNLEDAQAFVEPDFAVSQLFILISASLDLPKELKRDNLRKALKIFFYGILATK